MNGDDLYRYFSAAKSLRLLLSEARKESFFERCVGEFSEAGERERESFFYPFVILEQRRKFRSILEKFGKIMILAS